jgi:hypothetical protein
MTALSRQAFKVRQTATRDGNVPRRHVGRISVSLGLALAALSAASMAKAEGGKADNWNIRIIPATKMLVPPPPPMIDQAAGVGPTSQATTSQGAPRDNGPRIVPGPTNFRNHGRAPYYQIYRTIPFSRAEYMANPSYRNDLTMGLIFNQLPYTTVFKQMGPPSMNGYGPMSPSPYGSPPYGMGPNSGPYGMGPGPNYPYPGY